MSPFFSRAAVFTLLVLGTSCTPHLSGAALPKVPDFELPALSGGGPVAFSKTNTENPVLLVFWASWCPSCVKEIPALNEIQKEFSPQGLKVLAVNVEESRQTILDFQKKHPMNYPILLDEEGDVAAKFGLAGIPASILAEKGGKVLYFGFSLPVNLEKLLQMKRGNT